MFCFGFLIAFVASMQLILSGILNFSKIHLFLTRNKKKHELKFPVACKAAFAVLIAVLAEAVYLVLFF